MGNNQSRELQWFVDILQNVFGVQVDTNEIGVEATELGMEEVEEFFVPRELFEVLPESFVYEIMIADDPTGNVWIGAVAFYPDSPEWCIQVVTKNGDMVLRKVLPFTD